MNILKCILKYIWSLRLVYVLYLFVGYTNAQQITGLQASIITEKPVDKSDFPIVDINRSIATIRYDSSDYKGVIRAIGDLQNDIDRVTGIKPKLIATGAYTGYEIIIGTLGQSKLIDQLVKTKKIDVTDLKGKWESFVIVTIPNPNSITKNILVIAGSDKRGTIYGIYELSQQLGVSPWYWWADVPAKKRNSAYVPSGRYSSGEPKVRYRGIFINDEAPCFTGWSKEKFVGLNSKMYSHV